MSFYWEFFDELSINRYISNLSLELKKELAAGMFSYYIF